MANLSYLNLLERKILAIFLDVKKFASWRQKTHLLLIFVNKKFFFQKYIEIELKIFFRNIWRMFQMAKIKYSNSNFRTKLYYMQINNTYIMWIKEFYIYQSLWTDSPSTGWVTLIQELFNTYQRCFYFQYYQFSDQLKISKNLCLTLLCLPRK